jgi:hypothetical protein
VSVHAALNFEALRLQSAFKHRKQKNKEQNVQKFGKDRDSVNQYKQEEYWACGICGRGNDACSFNKDYEAECRVCFTKKAIALDTKYIASLKQPWKLMHEPDGSTYYWNMDEMIQSKVRPDNFPQDLVEKQEALWRTQMQQKKKKEGRLSVFLSPKKPQTKV